MLNICLICLLGLLSSFGYASELSLNESSLNEEAQSENLLSQTDELELEFELPSNSHPGYFWQGLKTTLQQDVTHANGVENNSRSKFQLSYENSVVEGLYFKAQGSYRYFYESDALAIAKGKSYGHSKVQLFWLQYSTGPCAYTFGRQSVAWGEVDGSFVVDVLTPFDLTEQLFTDYSDLRQSDNMLVMECFLNHSQTQFFYTPKASVTTFTHNQANVDSGHEWGGRFKFNLADFDVSIMLAQLYWNTPALSPINFEWQSQSYDFFGVALSKPIGRLLFKMDGAYKTDQAGISTADLSDTWALAFGLEYTTQDNQNYNVGLWQQNSSSNVKALNTPLQVTLGWNQSLLHDNLSLSLLVNVSQQPNVKSMTWLGAYKLNDTCTFTGAISLAQVIPLPKEALSLSVNAQF